MDGDRAVRRDDRHLAQIRVRIGGHEAGQRLLGRLARPEQLEAERAVAQLGHRLGRDGAHAWNRPRHDCAAPQRPRLDRYAEVTRLGVPGDDRVGQEPLARSDALWARFASW